MRKEKIFAKIPQIPLGKGITFARFEAGNAAKPVEIPRRFCYNKTAVSYTHLDVYKRQLVPYDAEDVAALRLVTSLALVERQVKNAIIISVFLAVAILPVSYTHLR